jgi:hypothetical protein
VGTTLPYKEWSFTEGFKPGHHTNVGKALKLRGARVIYRVRQITHRAKITNKRDQVIVTMHTSKLKTKQEQKI